MNEEEFFNKYVMRNPFDFKKSIIAHCRTLDKYDVYQWVADDEEKIKNLLEENNQLKEQLEASERARKEAIELVKNNQRKDEFVELNEWQARDLISILDIDKGE